jgi:hypothetical protein
MKFIEFTGKKLFEIVKNDEFSADDLRAVGVNEDTILRINQHGDIEIRRPEGWDIIGGLLGDFQERVRKKTGLDWS